jgi:hypothetical protein
MSFAAMHCDAASEQHCIRNSGKARGGKLLRLGPSNIRGYDQLLSRYMYKTS